MNKVLSCLLAMMMLVVIIGNSVAVSLPTTNFPNLTSLQFINGESDIEHKTPPALQKFKDAAVRISLYNEDDIDDSPNCSGIQISSKQILTAAHCLFNNQKEIFNADDTEIFLNFPDKTFIYLAKGTYHILLNPKYHAESQVDAVDNAIIITNDDLEHEPTIGKEDILTKQELLKQWVNLPESNQYQPAQARYLFAGISAYLQHGFKEQFNLYLKYKNSNEEHFLFGFLNDTDDLLLRAPAYSEGSDSGSGMILCTYNEQDKLSACKLIGVHVSISKDKTYSFMSTLLNK